jgi:hypothetical protein
MTCRKWLIVAGGFLLLLGLVTALVSTHLGSRVMGKAELGMAVLAPNEGSPEWQEKERLRARADCWFWVGIGLTACGVVLQTLGGILPLK